MLASETSLTPGNTQMNDAMTDLAKAISLDPSELDSYMQRGQMLLKFQDFRCAIRPLLSPTGITHVLLAVFQNVPMVTFLRVSCAFVSANTCQRRVDVVLCYLVMLCIGWRYYVDPLFAGRPSQISSMC